MDIWVLILPLVRVSLYVGMMLVNGSILYGLLLGTQMTAGSKAHIAGLVRAGALFGLATVAVQILAYRREYVPRPCAGQSSRPT